MAGAGLVGSADERPVAGAAKRLASAVLEEDMPTVGVDRLKMTSVRQQVISRSAFLQGESAHHLNIRDQAPMRSGFHLQICKVMRNVRRRWRKYFELQSFG